MNRRIVYGRIISIIITMSEWFEFPKTNVLGRIREESYGQEKIKK